jgi:hypothetical protein
LVAAATSSARSGSEYEVDVSFNLLDREDWVILRVDHEGRSLRVEGSAASMRDAPQDRTKTDMSNIWESIWPGLGATFG